MAKVEADIRADIAILAHCHEDVEGCPPAAQRFLAIIEEGRAHNDRARIGVINRAINLAIAPVSDFAQWGEPDHWSSPLETLSTGRGDCEDYAIAKYVALVEAGIAQEDVKLIIEHDLARNQDHAVVATRLNGDWIILDNRWFALVRDIESRRVIPLSMLDDNGVQQFARNKDDRSIGLADNREIVPAEIPTLVERPKPHAVTEQRSKHQSTEWSAFLDRLTSSVDSGSPLIVEQLTIESMREYARRTYRSHKAEN